jgi:hypothetical protein
MGLDESHGVIGRPRLGHHLEAVLGFQNEAQPTTNHGVVFGEDDGDPVGCHGPEASRGAFGSGLVGHDRPERTQHCANDVSILGGSPAAMRPIIAT